MADDGQPPHTDEQAIASPFEGILTYPTVKHDITVE